MSFWIAGHKTSSKNKKSPLLIHHMFSTMKLKVPSLKSSEGHPSRCWPGGLILLRLASVKVLYHVSCDYMLGLAVPSLKVLFYVVSTCFPQCMIKLLNLNNLQLQYRTEWSVIAHLIQVLLWCKESTSFSCTWNESWDLGFQSIDLW